MAMTAMTQEKPKSWLCLDFSSIVRRIEEPDFQELLLKAEEEHLKKKAVREKEKQRRIDAHWMEIERRIDASRKENERQREREARRKAAGERNAIKQKDYYRRCKENRNPVMLKLMLAVAGLDEQKTA